MSLDYACAYLEQYLTSDGAKRAWQVIQGAVAALLDRNNELEAEIRSLRLQLDAERS